jgi:methionyl aminopeptidase
VTDAVLVQGSEARAAAAAAAIRVVKVHEALTEFLRAGLTLPEIDAFVGRTLEQLDCKSAFRGYTLPGLPAFPSQSCISVNDCIVHGTHTMSQDPLSPGDLISVDIGVSYRGWIGDAAWTWAIEHASDESARLMDAGRRSLAAGIDAMMPGRPLLDYARAVQGVAEEECGFRLIRGLGGHGYGRTLHAPPFVSNVVPTHRNEWPDATRLFETGLLVAVEPMLAISSSETNSERGKWPITTPDGSLSVHYEADILIGDDAPIDLTKGLASLPSIVG